MAAEINPVENLVDYEPWFKAVSWGDWCAAKQFLTLHPSAITATYLWKGTTLHIATYEECEKIVEELVQLMTEEQLETKNGNGETALSIAAGAGNIKIIQCLVAKNKKLLGIAEDSSQMTPIVIVAKYHRWDIVRYLYSETPLEDLKPDKGHCGSQLVTQCLQGKQFDIVWELLEHCPGLERTKGLTSYPIYGFASLPSAFSSGTSATGYHPKRFLMYGEMLMRCASMWIAQFAWMRALMKLQNIVELERLLQNGLLGQWVVQYLLRRLWLLDYLCSNLPYLKFKTFSKRTPQKK